VYCAGKGATFTSLRLEINLEIGGEGNIVIHHGVVDRVRNFFHIPNYEAFNDDFQPEVKILLFYISSHRLLLQ